jgi:hypothetical protein
MGLAVAVLLAAAPPCRACSCAPSTPQGAFRKADAAFVGRVVRDTMVAKGTTQTFEVDEVYKGALTSRIDVWAEVGTEWVSSCAILYPAGEPVALLLFADDRGRWQASACSQVTRAELRRIGGEPHEPLPVPDAEVAAPPGGPGTRDVGGGLPAWAVVLIGASVAVGLVGGQIVWAGRRDRRAAFPSGWDPVDTEPHGTR